MNETMTLSVEPSEKSRVSSAALIRRSGLLAVAAGASMALVPLVHPESPQSAAWVPVHVLYFATLMVILLALIGVFARQLQQAGRTGVVGFLAAFFGTAMMLLEGREHLFSHDFGQGTLTGLWQLILASFVFSIGYVVLGVTTARAGVLPRGAGILLAVGGPVVAFSPPIGIQAVIVIGHALFGLGLAWLGYALLTGPEREPAEALDRG
jgi:hypothetical protein